MDDSVKAGIELKRLEFQEFFKNNSSKQQDKFEENNEGLLKQVEVVAQETTSIEYESSTHSLPEDNVDASSKKYQASSSEISSIDENEISDLDEDALISNSGPKSSVFEMIDVAPVSEMVPLAPKTNSPISELSLDDEEYNESIDESPSVETKKPAPEKGMNING